MDLEGRHVVIFSGSSGMGLATAAGATAAGAKVTIASSDQSRLDAALASLPGGCDGVVVDARSEASVAGALAQIGVGYRNCLSAFLARNLPQGGLGCSGPPCPGVAKP